MQMTMTRGLAAALLSGAVMFSAAQAQADPADSQSCLRLDRQVGDALSNHADSANHSQAMRERFEGQRACRSGYYETGMHRYAEALQLLGEQPHA